MIMQQEDINKAFNAKWRTLVENTGSPLRNIVEVKELCRDFFQTGILVQEGLMCCADEDEIAMVDSFQRWWDIYDKKRNRDKCFKKWKKMPMKDRIDCYHNTPAYVRSTPDKQYRKDPFTYLNQKAWNDEIIVRDTQEQQRNFRLGVAANVIASYTTENGQPT